ncbi:MAG: hypothetical protein M1833_006190 [Piccolia ochrophora]|nr:MAG: hypothetical protein M1833_006190 [Piccolia ochrophora]
MYSASAYLLFAFSFVVAISGAHLRRQYVPAPPSRGTWSEGYHPTLVSARPPVVKDGADAINIGGSLGTQVKVGGEHVNSSRIRTLKDPPDGWEGLDSTQAACFGTETDAFCLPTGTYDFGHYQHFGGRVGLLTSSIKYLMMPAGSSVTFRGSLGDLPGEEFTFTSNQTRPETDDLPKQLLGRINQGNNYKDSAQMIVSVPTNPTCIVVFEWDGFKGYCLVLGPGEGYPPIFPASFAFHGDAQMDGYYKKVGGEVEILHWNRTTPDFSGETDVAGDVGLDYIKVLRPLQIEDLGD